MTGFITARRVLLKTGSNTARRAGKKNTGMNEFIRYKK